MLSPPLFNLCIADLNKVLAKIGIEGVKLGQGRVWLLTYADDMVLVAKNRVALIDMMETLRIFLQERCLKLNVAKIKVMMFNKEENAKKKKWQWKGKNIEEVGTFKYIGFVFNRKGNYNDYIKEMSRKGKLAMNKIWGLGKRVCRDNFLRRWMLFVYLVKSVIK